MTTRRDTGYARAGFALPAAIMALVLLSALVAGALFVSTEELRAGRTDVADQRALAEAEWGLERAIAGWDSGRNTSLAVGGTSVVDSTGSTGADTVVVRVTRVQRQGFWITAAAASRGDGSSLPARHTVGASIRLIPPNLPVIAALTATGTVTVDAGVVDGRDTRMTAGAAGICDDDATGDGAAVVVPDSSLVCGSSCAGSVPPGVVGTPPIVTVPSLTSDSAVGLAGGGARSTLLQRVSIDIEGGTLAPRPVVTGGQCDRSDVLNWGDPGGVTSCSDWYPVIHVRGSAVLAAGAVGQGVLIVDGSLRVEAGARFTGVVMVGDDVTVTGVGAEIVGTVFAADVDRIGGTRVADGGAIRFGRCAVGVALLGASRLARTPVRWWAELR